MSRMHANTVNSSEIPFGYILKTLVITLFFIFGFQSQSYATCLPGEEGQLVYNGTDKVMQYCDGSNWIAMNPPGSGSGGCTNPTSPEGSMVFNAQYRVNMICAGNVYQAMGPYYDPNLDITDTGSGQVLPEYFQELDVTANTACGIKDDGSIWCWGADSEGALGNGGPTSEFEDDPVNIPTQITFTGQFSDLQVGRALCAIRDDGRLFCWGRFRWHWNSTPTDESEGETWKDIEAGAYERICGIRSDDRLFCWGTDGNGNLGNGALGDTVTPIEIDGGGTWQQVEGNCALRSDDTIWCWGSNGDGQLGNGTTGGFSEVPVLVSGGHTWKELFDSHNGYCAIRDDDTLWCWGSDGWGELPNGTSGDSNVPVQISIGGTWRTFSGGRHACAIRMDNSLWCWGQNNTGQLGDGTTTDRSNPVNIEPGTEWVEVGTDTDNQQRGITCATRLDGARLCWGQNTVGQLGSLTANNNVSDMTAIDDTGVYTSIYSSDRDLCAIRNDNTLWCWGDDLQGVLGNGVAGASMSPVQVDGGGTWQSVGMSTSGPNASHACAIRDDDTLWCWGDNDHGQIGVGVTGTANYDSPVQVSVGTTWKMVATGHWQNGDGHTCAIRSDDSLWCWGRNGDGQLGIGSNTDQNTPQEVLPGTTWKYIDLDTQRGSCGIQSDDRLYCWGNNQDGKFMSTGSSSTVPEVRGTETWLAVETGNRRLCAIRTDGSYWCDGIGIGSPENVQPGSVFTKIGTAGGDSNDWCVIRDDNTAWCGSNAAGFEELLGGPWIDVADTDGNTCGIRAGTGQIYCKGQAGNELGFVWNTTQTTAVLGDCGSPITQIGGIRYDTNTNAMIYCDGVGFRTIGK